MSTSLSSKTHCFTCHKGMGQFTCEGCLQKFCMQHVVEHRQVLKQQLDELILEHNAFQQVTHLDSNEYESVISSINQWERKSIEKIREIAAEVRQEVSHMKSRQKKEKVEMPEVQELTKRLRKAREDDDYFERDLREWKSLLEKVKQQTKTNLLSMKIKEDQRTPLIYRIRLDCLSTDQKSFDTDDRFEYCYGNAIIGNDGYLVRNGNDSFFGTEIRGKIEYSCGKHRLRFRIENNPSKICIFISIICRITQMGGNLFTCSSVYGWGDYDDYFLAGQRQKPSNDVFFLHTQEKDIIELVIDCSKRMIYYRNERHKNKQEINIDINKCPFPWQLYISLGGRGDQISLLKTTT